MRQSYYLRSQYHQLSSSLLFSRGQLKIVARLPAFVQQLEFHHEVIFELHWFARVPLARQGPGSTSMMGKSRGVVHLITPHRGSLRNQLSVNTETCCSQLNLLACVQQLYLVVAS
jgi:hypothetical protein